MTKNFLEVVQSITPDYGADYRARVLKGINAYMDWMAIYTKGNRFFRFKHLYHGASGLKRANELKALVSSPAVNNFYAIVNEVGKTISQSSNTEHSLRRFIYQELTEQIVIGCKPRVSQFQFEKTCYGSVRNELITLRDPVREPSPQGPQSVGGYLIPEVDKSPAQYFSYWTLTEVVQKMQIRSIDPDATIELPDFVRDVANLVLRLVHPKQYNYRDHNIHQHHIQRR